MNIATVCEEINNYFDLTLESGIYEITANTIEGTFTNDYLVGQYIRIRNSILNDGVYKITLVEANKITVDETLIAENTTRNICLYALAIPNDFLTLVNEIIASGNESNVQSETVSRYSVTYGAKGSSWINTYASSLNKWRKMRWC